MQGDATNPSQRYMMGVRHTKESSRTDRLFLLLLGGVLNLMRIFELLELPLQETLSARTAVSTASLTQLASEKFR